MHARGSGVDYNGCCSGPRTPHRAHHVMDDGEPPRPVEEPHNGEQCVRERLRGRPVRRRRGQDWAEPAHGAAERPTGISTENATRISAE